MLLYGVKSSTLTKLELQLACTPPSLEFLHSGCPNLRSLQVMRTSPTGGPQGSFRLGAEDVTALAALPRLASLSLGGLDVNTGAIALPTLKTLSLGFAQRATAAGVIQPE